MKLILTAIFAALFIGCASTQNNGHIKAGDSTALSIGMTKEEVIRKLGRPETVSASGDGETLSYTLERPWWQDRPFRVKLVNGKVESFDMIEAPGAK